MNNLDNYSIDATKNRASATLIKCSQIIINQIFAIRQLKVLITH